jgi:hypothetical protein
VRGRVRDRVPDHPLRGRGQRGGEDDAQRRNGGGGRRRHRRGGGTRVQAGEWQEQTRPGQVRKGKWPQENEKIELAIINKHIREFYGFTGKLQRIWSFGLWNCCQLLIAMRPLDRAVIAFKASRGACDMIKTVLKTLKPRKDHKGKNQ